MTDPTSGVPWWYVATLAGVFTLVGVMASLTASWLIARRKNRLDDFRRFEGDIIEAYIRLDEIADVLHNNAGGDLQEEKNVYWKVYPEVIRIVTRLSLIATPKIIDIARHYKSVVYDMAPGTEPSDLRPHLMSMPELVEDLDELRRVIRRELRVGPAMRQSLRERIASRYHHLRFVMEERRFLRDVRRGKARRPDA